MKCYILQFYITSYHNIQQGRTENKMEINYIYNSIYNYALQRN